MPLDVESITRNGFLQFCQAVLVSTLAKSVENAKRKRVHRLATVATVADSNLKPVVELAQGHSNVQHSTAIRMLTRGYFLVD